ncbi:uncharacterized protein L969DRAFT_381960 [Mixia osmundae IAM 14324]|uniref:uncharacterized protein n=1 Tax=Mixia osmundae (strain CBS 9802 / IAM 14324 / JCM 22182 / KY 12970) TaxID=764103 RepID=UPI0004A55226|nr:uncharacterized protein L969DRAFT_381960 [Mixia osmundae IAM 14324]KEI39806.1 hypothetical protein L969DRAFT_381960 [Mixia osmundae IAM 14324]
MTTFAASQVTQDVKLPALYLLDSISKNIGSVYPDQFSRFVERVFLTAFQDADQSMQVKLEELLGTWRTGGRNGSELFAPGVYQSIANNVASIRGTDESDGQQPATPGERAGALYDIRRLLVKRQEEALTSPQDETIATQIMILTQLEGLVKVQQLTSAQIIAIHDQIATLSPVTAEDGITPQIAEIAVSADGENLPDLAALSSLMDPDLLRQALGSGWNAAAPAKPLVTKIDPIEDRYQSMLLSFEISLTTSDIQRYRPDAPALIYDELPEACKQCGTRFLSGDNGSRKMQSHLDWHFRRNKRLLEKARPQSRSWLIMSEEWLAPPGQIKTEETQLVEEDEEEPLDPEKCIVKVTESTGTRSRACPICQETIETKLTDEEDYIWTNAVQVGGKIYHATCHAEMTKARRLAKVEDDYDAYDETKPEQQLSVNRVAIDAEDSVLPPLKEEDESAAALLLSPVAPSLDPPSSSNHSRASSESPSAQTQSPSRASSPSLAEPSRSADAAPIAASDGAESAGLRAAQEPSDALAVTAGEIEDELDYTAASSDDDAALYDDTGAASSLAGKRRISPSAGSTEPKRARQEES